jgi:tRNA(Ile)-lysidine synthase
MLCVSRLPGKVKISYDCGDMQDLQQRFAAALDALRPGSTLVIGVSGGIDSMALLELLQASGKKLVVAHFNHQLRGAESDGDEVFVREQAEKRGLEFRVGRGDVRAEAKGISIEMAARKLRHAFLAEIAREHEADIVLAHHADDQIETVLMRAQRGIAGYGAGGMRAESPSPAEPRIRILRPLLTFRKVELRQLVEGAKIPFREDSSNAEPIAERNRVRHELLPQLRERMGEKVEMQLLQSIAARQRMEDSSKQIARAWLEDSFYDLPEDVRRDIIVMQLHRAKIPPSGATIFSLVRNPAKPVMIRPGLTVTLDSDGLLQVREEVLPPIPVWVHLQSGENVAQFDGGTLRWDFEGLGGVVVIPQRDGWMWFDYARVGNYALLRYPQEGDRVRLSDRGSARPLLDVLGRNKIPRDRRDRVVVATTQSGEIFWVEGLRITEDFKVTEKTRTAVGWNWTRPSGGD